MKPVCSIVFVTKRPGGMDVLLGCLAKQTFKEKTQLIIVDDAVKGLSTTRYSTIMEYAKELKLLDFIDIDYIQSKPKKYRFGLCQAMNNGLEIAKSETIVFLQDYCWLPERFLGVVNAFYSDQRRNGKLLAFCEKYYLIDNIDPVKFEDPLSLSIFTENLTDDPKNYSVLFKDIHPDYTKQVEATRKTKTHKPEDDIFIIDDLDVQNPIFTKTLEVWECFCCAAPRDILERIGGFTPELDLGDDSQERDVARRARMLGYRVMVCATMAVSQITHTKYTKIADERAGVYDPKLEFGIDEMWSRKPEHTNGRRLNQILENIFYGFRLLKTNGIPDTPKRSLVISSNDVVRQYPGAIEISWDDVNVDEILDGDLDYVYLIGNHPKIQEIIDKLKRRTRIVLVNADLRTSISFGSSCYRIVTSDLKIFRGLQKLHYNPVFAVRPLSANNTDGVIDPKNVSSTELIGVVLGCIEKGIRPIVMNDHDQSENMEYIRNLGFTIDSRLQIVYDDFSKASSIDPKIVDFAKKYVEEFYNLNMWISSLNGD